MTGMRTHHDHDPLAPPPVLSRRQLLLVVAAAVVPVAYVARPDGSPLVGRDAGSAAPTSSSTTGEGLGRPTPAPTALVAPPTTVEAIIELDHPLYVGLTEPKVAMLQARLADLGFDPGPIDGYFGSATEQAVWAFQKLIMGRARADADGVVQPEFWQRLFDDVAVSPRRRLGGVHMEVYLPEQVAVLFVDGAVGLISHISSGAGVEWCDEVTFDNDDGTTETKGICGRSVTPGGTYHFERKVEGWRSAKLGRLYKPVYFNYGIAIHGASNVPNEPASRGCVRFPMHIAEYLQDLVSIGDAIYVFDGVEEPETYGAQPMIFDWPDPNFTTTTTTTTLPSTTTTPPPTSTTSAPPTAVGRTQP